MTSIFLFFIILSSALAAPFDTWNCSPQLSKLTQEWKASGEWIKQDINGLDSFFYASPTDKVGQWILIRKTQKGIGVAKVDQAGRLEASFEDTSCKPKIKPFTSKRPSENFFTDEALADFIKKNKSGIIYVWSPRMNLSDEGLKEIIKAASATKYPLLVLLSKDVTEKEYQTLQKELGTDLTRRVDSFDFKMRNVDQHYPALLTFKNGLINSRIKYGYEKATGYMRDINELMGK